jgi:C1A family cysteine protease
MAKSKKSKRANIVAHKIKKFGWVPDIPDGRDHLYAAPSLWLKKMPAKVDLRSKCPPIYDQGQLGSCTANAIGASVQFLQMKQKLKNFVPSRLFIYYNERVMEGTVSTDSGAMIRDGIKSVGNQGNCPEKMWPYSDKDPGLFTQKPPAECYTKAVDYQALNYKRVPRNLSQMKGCLAAGFPFVYGFSVYDSFETDKVAKTGEVPMPNVSKEELLGGHAVLAVGYDEKKARFIVRNSWGTVWGIKGYFTMPYRYLLDDNLSDDFWTIRLVEGTS